MEVKGRSQAARPKGGERSMIRTCLFWTPIHEPRTRLGNSAMNLEFSLRVQFSLDT